MNLYIYEAGSRRCLGNFSLPYECTQAQAEELAKPIIRAVLAAHQTVSPSIELRVSLSHKGERLRTLHVKEDENVEARPVTLPTPEQGPAYRNKYPYLNANDMEIMAYRDGGMTFVSIAERVGRSAQVVGNAWHRGDRAWRAMATSRYGKVLLASLEGITGVQVTPRKKRIRKAVT